LPVYLFALSQAASIDWKNALQVFIILHLLVYPSSNGYNSYMDRDETPIGGLQNPLPPTRQLFLLSIFMDVVALLASLFITPFFALGILLYIMASRAYSYRGIRLKQYPITGFLTVFIFQGALIFLLTSHAVNPAGTFEIPWLDCLIASLLIGALYPLTQVYQHKEDRKDGVTTISYLLGKKGSFVFSMLLFLLATLLLYLRFHNRLNLFYLFLLIMLPVVLFFLYWMRKVWQNEAEASFKNSLVMNILSTLCTTAFFLTLILLKF
jgi:1,4-dihydroxy-2-naphthoate polyprenyltransferase